MKNSRSETNLKGLLASTSTASYGGINNSNNNNINNTGNTIVQDILKNYDKF